MLAIGMVRRHVRSQRETGYVPERTGCGERLAGFGERIESRSAEALLAKAFHERAEAEGLSTPDVDNHGVRRERIQGIGIQQPLRFLGARQGENTEISIRESPPPFVGAEKPVEGRKRAVDRSLNACHRKTVRL
jgi:hypothetical protein